MYRKPEDEIIQIEEARVPRAVKGDPWIIILTAILVVFGIAMVFSASYYIAISRESNPYSYFFSHLMYVAVGLVPMLFAMFFDYHKWLAGKLYWVFYMIGAALLVLVLLIGTTSDTGGQRWIPIAGFTLMPGEIAKLTGVAFLSGYLSQSKSTARRKYWKTIFIYGLIYMGLVYLQPNLSTAIIIAAIFWGELMIAGSTVFELLTPLIGGAGALIAYGIFGTNYQAIRIKSFLGLIDSTVGKSANYQVDMSLIAIGSGGLNGLGIGQSVQKTLYLPMPHNDFIFSVFAEECGFIGATLLILVYLLFIWRGCLAAMRAKDLKGTLLAGGCTIMIAAQTIMHIAVCTNLMPATGVILPFVSSGGNALLVCMTAAGIIYNVSRQPKEESAEEIE